MGEIVVSHVICGNGSGACLAPHFPNADTKLCGKGISKHQLILKHRRLEGKLEAASLVSKQKLCITSDICLSAVRYLMEEIQEEEWRSGRVGEKKTERKKREMVPPCNFKAMLHEHLHLQEVQGNAGITPRIPPAYHSSPLDYASGSCSDICCCVDRLSHTM